MANIKVKKDEDTLEITTTLGTTITTISRAEIQTAIDHKEFDKTKLQLEIDELKADLAILDA